MTFGSKQPERDQHAEERLAAQQQVAPPERAARQKGRQRHDDRVLGLQAEPAPQPEQHPLPRLAANDQSHRRQQRECRRRELEERRMEEHGAAQGVGRDEPGRGREHLQPLPGAELARDRAGRDRSHDRQQRAEQAQADQRRPDRARRRAARQLPSVAGSRRSRTRDAVLRRGSRARRDPTRSGRGSAPAARASRAPAERRGGRPR